MTIRHAAGLALVAVALSQSSVSFADDAPAARKVVVLRDGSVFQGELVEIVPGDHTTLKLATGEVRRFEASEMLSATQAPTLTLPALSPLLNTMRSSPNDYEGADQVRVHIETNKPNATYLFQAAAAGPQVGWNRLCLAPCDLPVDPSRTYRIGGERIGDSEPFRLTGKSSQTLYVDATTAGLPAFGWGSLVLGLALSVPATYLLTRKEPSDDEAGSSGDKIVGWVLLANGVPWLITGVALLAMGGTTVKADDGRQVGARATTPSLSLGSLGQLTSSGWVF